MRRFGFVLVAVALASANAASAGPSAARAAAAQKAARSKAAPKPKVKDAKAALAASGAKAALSAHEPKPLAIPVSALLTQYQRVGRALLLLANDRRAQIGVGTEAAKLSCAELQATFRSIKIDDAVKTAESRAAAAAVLSELHDKVERLRGVALTQDCLNNPLAKDCT